MSSLVEELQRDALDGEVDVSDLLRKAYAVAVKLKLAKFKAWVSAELNGYKEDLPTYRVIHGVLRAWNPYNGWIPVMFESSRDGDQLSVHKEFGPIGPVQDLLRQSDGKTDGLIVHLTPRQQAVVQRGFRLPLEASLHIGRSSLVKIVDAVRNLILDWSLTLEADNILGEGMTFSTEEKRLAERNADELQASVINIGTMVNSSIQQGSPKARLKSAK